MRARRSTEENLPLQFDSALDWLRRFPVGAESVQLIGFVDFFVAA
jgi:hypothetical protein